MATDHRTRIAGIRRFDQLVAYLRDDMGWPIESADFEDLTFDYTPEELGIDAKNAAKIQEIKRLRPLAPGQPWGIFFVKFEPKRLPVVALRRILSQVALKKRASANKAEQQAWAADDLLFISNYGEDGERRIAFAHFAKPTDKSDLPTLKVLGWDNLDTPLHLDDVADKLVHHLSWPEDTSDEKRWRARWRGAFVLRHGEVVSTSKELSVRLAELARAIRDRIKTAISIETEKGPLTKLMKAFQTTLVHDLTAEGFADMYAQTIAYGLLSSRIADPKKKTADDFAAHMRTNPFLRELMETFLKVGGRKGKKGGPGIDFDELGVSEVIELLDNANMEAVIRDFGDRNPQEDPVIHFYELFLKEYDAKKRMQRGVFYTPRPVVSFIVRSVHELLRTEFGLEDGLADTTTWGEMVKRHKGLKIPDGVSAEQDFVQILDPATGTGTFLVEVISSIHATLVAKWKKLGHDKDKIGTLWNEYVPRHLLTRMCGYELLMAPYAIAHLKIGLKLFETGYLFDSSQRARVFLTNALEPAQHNEDRFDFAVPALAKEGAEVNSQKKIGRFTVLIGNPPYSNFGQLNRIPQILDLLRDYKEGLQERKINLDDDFIKFIRLAQYLIEITGVGVVGFITNNIFFDGITHRRMRSTLRSVFDLISVCDLHGSSKKLEKAPDGSKDENVFDIQQGVGLTFMVARSSARSEVRFAELWGSRAAKYAALESRDGGLLNGQPLNCEQPHFFFSPKVFFEGEIWQQWCRIPDLMPVYSTGVKTHLDGVLVGFSKDQVKSAISEFLQANWQPVSLSSAKRASPLRKAILLKAALDVSQTEYFKAYAYRAFDTRVVAYLPSSIEAGDHRQPVMRHFTVPNMALVTTRQLSRGLFNHVIVVNALTDMCVLSTATKECAYVFPLKLMSEGGLFGTDGNDANLSRAAIEFLRTVSGSPEDFLQFSLAILSSGEYRRRYLEYLKIDFPRIPLSASPQLFHALSNLGEKIVESQLMKSCVSEDPIGLVEGGLFYVEKVSWSDDTVWLNKAETIGFKGVSSEIWNFFIGGYQVCAKWLKDRRGNVLSPEEIAHYRKVVVAIADNIRLTREIDKVIEHHGGWPGAFQARDAISKQAKVIPFRPRSVQPAPKERYHTCLPLMPLKAAAGAFSAPQHIEDDSFEWVEVDTNHRLREGMFVSQVVGRSMEPLIPDGSYCLFRAPVEGTRQGKTVLVQLRDVADPETSQRFTVKRYKSDKAADGDSWRHERITLEPLNLEFKPIVMTDAEEGSVQVIAELVEVLPGKSD